MTDYEEKSLAKLSEVSMLLAKVLSKMEELDRRLDSIAYSCKEIHLELPGQGNWNFECRSPRGQY